MATKVNPLYGVEKLKAGQWLLIDLETGGQLMGPFGGVFPSKFAAALEAQARYDRELAVDPTLGGTIR